MATEQEQLPPFLRRRAEKRRRPVQTEALQAIPRPGSADPEEVQAWQFAQAEKRLVAANEAIRSTRTFFFALLSIAAYIGVVIAGTTDEQLLRISPIKLPIVGVEVPLTGFYLFVPWLFVLLYFNLVIHLALTSRKLKRFLDDLAPLDTALSARLRNDVANFPLAQWMLRHQDLLLHGILSLLAWVLLVLIPPLLLLLMQLRFLAFQNATYTWLQAAAVAASVLMIVGYRAWFVRHIQPETRWLAGWRLRAVNADQEQAISFRLTVTQPLSRYLIPLVPLGLALYLAVAMSAFPPRWLRPVSLASRRPKRSRIRCSGCASNTVSTCRSWSLHETASRPPWRTPCAATIQKHESRR